MTNENKGWLTLAAEIAALVVLALDAISSPYGLTKVASLCGLLILVWLVRQQHVHSRLSYAWRTIKDFYPEFHVENNEHVWDSVVHEYRYLGIGASSLVPTLLRWLENRPVNDHRLFRFLLIDPDGSGLQHQICNEMGLPEPPSSNSSHDFYKRLAKERAGIALGLSALKNTAQFKAGRLEIRLYDDYVSWWMHIVDGQRLYLGLLKKGKSGMNRPVIVFGNVSGEYTLFDSFMEHWERLWASGQPSC